jgi:hypothetical protein
VRNPWDRLVSSYCFKSRKKSVGGSGDFRSYVDWVSSVLSARKSLTAGNCHLRPQVEFELEKLDFVGRFENFETELRLLFKTLNLPVKYVPHAHKSNRRHYADYYDERTRIQVGKIYAEDIEELGYTFES